MEWGINDRYSWGLMFLDGHGCLDNKKALIKLMIRAWK